FRRGEMVCGQAANFSDEAVVDRFNGDLANGLGNTVSRLVTLARRGFDNRTPPAGGAGARAPAPAAGGRRRRARRGRGTSAPGLPRRDGGVRVPPRARGAVEAARRRQRTR